MFFLCSVNRFLLEQCVGASFARDLLIQFQIFLIKKIMFERRNTLESEIFFCEQARELLKDKYILIIGDSVQVRLAENK